MSQELKDYVKTALAQGASKEGITATLTASGWGEAVVSKTLEFYVGVDANGLPIPAPRAQAHQIARDIFMYTLILITLSLSACALGGLLFSYIDRLVPDAVAGYHDYRRFRGTFTDSGISWSIAQLVVSFPVYLGLTGWAQREVHKSPQKRESLIRKLLIYAILGLTAVISLGDLISVLFTFLQGDITLRFFFKASVILGLSLMIFVYYLYEMRRDDESVRQKGKA